MNWFTDISMAPTADHFTRFDENRVSSIIVSPPWEPKGSMAQWARGSLRERGSSGYSDLVFTGPELRVTYSGCKWNKLVLSVDDKPATLQFLHFLDMVSKHVWTTVYNSPDKYKPGAKSSSRFTWDEELVKPSSDPNIYPDEIRTRLSTVRVQHETGEGIDTVDSLLFDHSLTPVDACNIMAGGTITPILKMTYFRNGERFGATLTVLQAMYEAPAVGATNMKVLNADWNFDMGFTDSN